MRRTLRPVLAVIVAGLVALAPADPATPRAGHAAFPPLRPTRVLVLGDWNDDIADAPSSNVFLPLLGKPDAYVTPTVDVAKHGGYSYIPFKRLIDHIVLTREAADTLQIHEVAPVALETSIADYLHTVSDHRPVRASLIPVIPL